MVSRNANIRPQDLTITKAFYGLPHPVCCGPAAAGRPMVNEGLLAREALCAIRQRFFLPVSLRAEISSYRNQI